MKPSVVAAARLAHRTRRVAFAHAAFDQRRRSPSTAARASAPRPTIATLSPCLSPSDSSATVLRALPVRPCASRLTSAENALSAAAIRAAGPGVDAVRERDDQIAARGVGTGIGRARPRRRSALTVTDRIARRDLPVQRQPAIANALVRHDDRREQALGAAARPHRDRSRSAGRPPPRGRPHATCAVKPSPPSADRLQPDMDQDFRAVGECAASPHGAVGATAMTTASHGARNDAARADRSRSRRPSSARRRPDRAPRRAAPPSRQTAHAARSSLIAPPAARRRSPTAARARGGIGEAQIVRAATRRDRRRRAG